MCVLEKWRRLMTFCEKPLLVFFIAPTYGKGGIVTSYLSAEMCMTSVGPSEKYKKFTNTPIIYLTLMGRKMQELLINSGEKQPRKKGEKRKIIFS